jgi:hypothetical protein
MSSSEKRPYEVGPYWTYMLSAEAQLFVHTYRQLGSWRAVGDYFGMSRPWITARLHRLLAHGHDVRAQAKLPETAAAEPTAPTEPPQEPDADKAP